MWRADLYLPRLHRAPAHLARSGARGSAHGLVLLSYNLHGGLGRDGVADLRRLVDVIRGSGARVVALQEVAGHGVPASWVDHLDYLAGALAMTPVAGPTLERGGGRFGNAVLSALPVRRRTRHDLSVPGREPRGALDLLLEPPGGGRLRLLATHLGLARAERRQQLRRLARLVVGDPGPLVVLGDFNEWLPRTPPLPGLTPAGGRLGPRTFPAGAPLLALDRALVRPASLLVHAGALATQQARLASDHLPLRLRLQLPA